VIKKQKTKPTPSSLRHLFIQKIDLKKKISYLKNMFKKKMAHFLLILKTKIKN
jgi:hypothetical protein